MHKPLNDFLFYNTMVGKGDGTQLIGFLDATAVLADRTKVNIEVQPNDKMNMDRRSLFHWGKLYATIEIHFINMVKWEDRQGLVMQDDEARELEARLAE